MKWCLCASRWKEAFDAAAKGSLSKSAVPQVYLHATHQSALDAVSYKDLKQYAAEGETPSSSQGNRQDTHFDPDKKKPGNGVAKESTEMSGNPDRAGGAGAPRTSPTDKGNNKT